MLRDISKSDYLLYRECRKNTWLKIHRPDIYYASELSDFEKSIIETGNEVENEARKLFPTGILIEGRDEPARNETAKLIKSAETSRSHSGSTNLTLFQAVFSNAGFMAACDILQYDHKSKSWTISEIKASNSVKEKLHLYDLAFQVNLLKKVGLNICSINIIILNAEYVREGQLDIVKLFKTENVTEQVNQLLEDVDLEMNEALKFLNQENEPRGPAGEKSCDCIYKGRSSHCTTFRYSNPEVPEYSVHDIARIGLSKAKLTELIDSNIFHIHQVPEELELSEIQKNQVNAEITGRTLLKTDKIAEELRSLQFPLYFLDYETYPSALPRFDGFSPYQQIPFQYSLHIIESRDKINAPIHREFLHTDSNDPSGALLAQLEIDIGKIGSVIVWNKKFETKMNNELAKRIPSGRKFIDDVNTRIYDLMDIFSKQHYVHKDFYGSTSIKYVLPVIAKMMEAEKDVAADGGKLSYKRLDIREGGTASMKWGEMTFGVQEGGGRVALNTEEKHKIARDLLKYCELDTYAMYAIWKHLWSMVS